MSEQISGQTLKNLLGKFYGVRVQGEGVRLPGEGGQQVFKVELDGGEVWTVRLGPASRSREKLVAETNVLRFLSRKFFPAPGLKPTLTGEALFEWQPDCWGYALEYIEGQHPGKPLQVGGQPGPMLDLASVAGLGRLLGRLHNLAFQAADGLPEFTWLDDVPIVGEWADLAAQHPAWSERAGEVSVILKNLPVTKLKSLPRVLTHTDAHEGNLLWTPQGELYLLDWENAGPEPAVIDCALALSWMGCWRLPAGVQPGQPAREYDFDPEYCKTFLVNYQQARVLSEDEREMLGPAIQFLNGWFAARNFKNEVAAPGSTGVMADLAFALLRSVTPQWATTLNLWAVETAPGPV